MHHRSPRKRSTPPATPATPAVENPSPLKSTRTNKSQTSPHATTSQQQSTTTEHTPHPFQLHQVHEKVSSVIPPFGSSIESASAASAAAAAATAFVSNSIPPIHIHSADTQSALTSALSNTYSSDEMNLSSLVPHFSPSLPSMSASLSSIPDLHTDSTHTNSTSQSHSNMSVSTSSTISGTKSLGISGNSTSSVRRMVRPIRKIAPVFLGKVLEPSAPLADTESEAERALRSGEFTTLSAAAEMGLHTPVATPRREALHSSDSTTTSSSAAMAAAGAATVSSYEHSSAATTSHSSISSLSASFFAPSPSAAPFTLPFFSPSRSPLQQVFDTQSRSPGGTTGVAPASSSQRRTGGNSSAFQQQLGNRTGRQLHTNSGSSQQSSVPHSFSTQTQQQQQPVYSFSPAASPQRPTLQITPAASAAAASSSQSSSDFAAVLMGQALPPQYLRVLQEAKAAKEADSAFASTYRPAMRAPTTSPSPITPASSLAPISSTWSSFRFDSHAFNASFSNDQAAQSTGVQASSNLASVFGAVSSESNAASLSTTVPSTSPSTSSSSTSLAVSSSAPIPEEDRAKVLQELENMFRTAHEAMAGLEPPPTPLHVDDHSSSAAMSLFRSSSAASESASSFTAVASAAAAATAMASSSSPVAAIVATTPSSTHLLPSFTPIPHSLSVHGEPLSHIPPALARGLASSTYTRRVAQDLEAAAGVRPPSVTNTVASTTPPPSAAPNTLLTLPLPSFGPLPPIPAFVDPEQLTAKAAAKGRATPASVSADSTGKRSRRGGVKRTSASLESTPVNNDESAASSSAPASEPTLRVKKRNVRAVLMQVEKAQQHMEWINAATTSAAADATPSASVTTVAGGVNLDQQLDLASTQAALALSTPIVTEEPLPTLAFPSPLTGAGATAVASSSSIAEATAPQLYTSGPLQLSNEQNRQLRSQIQLHLQLLVQSYWLCTVIPPAPSRNHSRAKKFPFHAALKQQALGMIEQMEQAAKGNFSNHMAELIVNFSTNVTSSPTNAASQASATKSKARGHQPNRSTSSNSSDSTTSSNSKLDELVSSATKPKSMHKRALLAEDEDDEEAAAGLEYDESDAGEDEVRVRSSSSKGKESEMDVFLNRKVFDPQPVPYSMTQPVVLPSHALPILNVPALHLWRDPKFEQINQTTPSNAMVPSAIAVVTNQPAVADEADKENAAAAAAGSSATSPYLGVYTKGANGRATLTLPVVAVTNFWGTLVAKYQLDARYLPRILVHERHLFTSAEEHLFKMGVKMMQWEMKQQQPSSGATSSSTALTTTSSSSSKSSSQALLPGEPDATIALELQMLAAVRKRFLPAKSVNELRTRYEKVKAREQELNIKRKFMSVQTGSFSSVPSASIAPAAAAGESPKSPSSPIALTASATSLPSETAATTITPSPLAVLSSASDDVSLSYSAAAAGKVALPASLDPASLPPLMELELQEVEQLRDFTARELAIVSAAVEEPALKASRNKWSTISSRYLPLWPRKLLAKAWMKHTMKQAKQLLPHLAAASKNAPRKPRAKKGAEKSSSAEFEITSPEISSSAAPTAFPLSSFSSPLPQSRNAVAMAAANAASNLASPAISSLAIPTSAASTLAASAVSELLTPRVSRPKKKGLEFDCVGEELMVDSEEEVENEQEEEGEEVAGEVSSTATPQAASLPAHASAAAAKDLELLSKFPASVINLSAAMTASPSTNPVAAAAAASTSGISMPHMPSFTPAKPAASAHFDSAA